MDRKTKLTSLWHRFAFAGLIASIAVTGVAWGGDDVGDDPTQIIIRGSSNLQPFVEEWVDAFAGPAAASDFSVTGDGTSEGIAALLAGRAHIAMASRSMNDEERLAAETGGIKIRETVVARMGIAVIVTKGWPITSLTTHEIAAIFAGSTTTWRALGGPDQTIIVVRKDSGWSPDFFRERIMEGKGFTDAAVVVDSKEDVVAEVGGQSGAIGFTGMPEAIPALDRVSLVRIVGDDSNSDATYALSRPFFFYTIEDTPLIEPFLAFSIGPEAQGMIVEAGFYPANQSDALAEE